MNSNNIQRPIYVFGSSASAMSANKHPCFATSVRQNGDSVTICYQEKAINEHAFSAANAEVTRTGEIAVGQEIACEAVQRMMNMPMIGEGVTVITFSRTIGNERSASDPSTSIAFSKEQRKVFMQAARAIITSTEQKNASRPASDQASRAAMAAGMGVGSNA